MNKNLQSVSATDSGVFVACASHARGTVFEQWVMVVDDYGQLPHIPVPTPDPMPDTWVITSMVSAVVRSDLSLSEPVMREMGILYFGSPPSAYEAAQEYLRLHPFITASRIMIDTATGGEDYVLYHGEWRREEEVKRSDEFGVEPEHVSFTRAILPWLEDEEPDEEDDEEFDLWGDGPYDEPYAGQFSGW